MKKITDTERLDWIVQYKPIITELHGAFRISIKYKYVSGWRDSARQAIDEAMNA